MNSQISFTLGDLGMLVLWALAVVVLVLLTLVLYKAYKFIKNATEIVEENRNNIDKVIDEAPGLTSNVNVILGEVAHGTKAFRSTVDNVAETADTITKPFKAGTPLLEKMSWVINTLCAVFYHKDKDDNSKRFVSKDEFAKSKSDKKQENKSSKMEAYEKVNDLSKKVADKVVDRSVEGAVEDWEDDLK